MSPHRVCGLVVLALCLLPGVLEGSSGPGEATGQSGLRASGQVVARHADFKVAVWYRKSDPLGSFQDQIYDMRKGEYTPAVDEWLKLVQTKYPGYYVAVRDVDLKREKGETELLKVGSVIYRELIGAAGSAGIVIGPGSGLSTNSLFGSSTRPQNASSSRPPGLNRPAGRDRDYLTPPATMFPVPVPIPNRPR